MITLTYQSPLTSVLPDVEPSLVLLEVAELLVVVAAAPSAEQKLVNQLWMLERSAAFWGHAASQTPDVPVKKDCREL